MDIREAVELLKVARKTEADFAANVEQAARDLEGTGIWEYLQQQKGFLATARADVADAEGRVRACATRIFEETGSKHPHPAIAIKMYTVLTYAADRALEYARRHLPGALKLDAKAFEKVAKVAGLDFVVISEEPRATIASDLSKY